jgi:LuxR family transcriptional regulator, quorum-sensing system regulator BjaR1
VANQWTKTQHLLTARQREIVALKSEGKTAWEISVILDIARITVEQHLTSAFRKTDTVNSAQLIKLAIMQGWIK